MNFWLWISCSKSFKLLKILFNNIESLSLKRLLINVICLKTVVFFICWSSWPLTLTGLHSVPFTDDLLTVGTRMVNIFTPINTEGDQTAGPTSHNTKDQTDDPCKGPSLILCGRYHLGPTVGALGVDRGLSKLLDQDCGGLAYNNSCGPLLLLSILGLSSILRLRLSILLLWVATSLLWRAWWVSCFLWFITWVWWRWARHF